MAHTAKLPFALHPLDQKLVIAKPINTVEIELIKKLESELRQKGTVDQTDLAKIETSFIYLLNEKDNIIDKQKNLLKLIQTYVETLGESTTGKAQNLLEESRKIPENKKYVRPIKPTIQTTIESKKTNSKSC